MADGAGSESYTYDRLGRTTQVQKTIHSVNYTVGYSFNLANQVASLTYPSGRVVNQNRDAIGRMASIQNNADQSNYVSSIAYNASNQVTGFNYGNGVTGSFGYSADRRQLTSLSYANGPTSLFSLGYGYAQNGANDGEITSITDSVDNGRSETYGYDSLNRLTAAQTTGSTNYPQWGLSETYDRYGNRTAQSVTAGTGPSNSVVIDPNTNRITDTGYSYDSSGNMTADGLNSLTYDAESRAVTSVSGGNTTNYTYTGSGMRVQKSAGGSSTQYIFASGKPIAEYNGSTLLTEYVYFGNQLVATLNSSGAPTYQHRDHLSIRLRTDSSGNVLAYQGHYPFGETWHNTGSPHQWMFTSYERDSESGNDYAIHRFDASRLGRFTTADPVRGRIRNPQRLNRYAYVVSDPVNRLDPQGLDDFLYQGDWGWPADRIGDFWGGGGGGWGVDSLGGWGIDGLGGWDFDGFGGVPNCPDCLRKGRDSFFQCLTYAGGAVGGAFLTCLGACLFVPGYVECAMACAEGADWAIQAVISVCATTGAASYLDCRWRRPANCP